MFILINNAMKLNIEIFKNIIMTKTTSIKKIYCVFAKFKLIIIIKKILIRDFDI